MTPAIQTSALILCAFLLLIWNQPGPLLRIAAWIERKIVTELRIRALALRDSQEAYRRAARWHRAQL